MWYLLAILAAAIAWLIFRPLKQPKIAAKPVLASQYGWPPLGEYEFEVVGESFYQPVLKALHDTVAGTDEEPTGTAVLVPENDNPHDASAVRVTVQGLTIGYLSANDARSFRRRLVSKKIGLVATSCGVLITGGYMLRDGQQAHYGAQLDMKPFDD